MRIVGVGGGTGLPILLRGLKRLSESGGPFEEEIIPAAVVCVSDNGGSSGSLRKSFGIPAVGDLRNCLVALANVNNPLGDLFQHRLANGDGLNGHPIGNLIVTALCQRTGSFDAAIRQAADLLQSTGRVFPVTEGPAILCGEFVDGSIARGEVQVAQRRDRIRRIWLEPDRLTPTHGVLEAIDAADGIVLGPGSLFTSIIPNLLIPSVAAAMRSARAAKIYVCNLMTQAGETDGLTASDHVAAVEEYLGSGVIDACVLNSRAIGDQVLTPYRAVGLHPVEADVDEIARRGVIPIRADVLETDSSWPCHDSRKLAEVVTSLTREIVRIRSRTVSDWKQGREEPACAES